MANRDFGLSVLLAITAIAMIFLTVLSDKSFAGETDDQRVQKALVDRTENFCDAVLPNWFASKLGVEDKNVRSVITDCYMGHARLAVLGVKSKFPLSKIDLSEVPATLLHEKAGINLDIYRPLAGRVLQTGASGN